MELILASSSPRRKELLENANIKFCIDAADIDETFSREQSPEENVMRISKLKALAVLDKHPDSLILGCDTIVVLDGIVYGKPKDEADAYSMLHRFSGKTHQVLSGVSLVTKDEESTFFVETKVTFKELSDEDIKDYIQSGEPFGKAGSYAIQGVGFKLIEKYEGELENVIGLPIAKIIPALKIYGI